MHIIKNLIRNLFNLSFWIYFIRLHWLTVKALTYGVDHTTSQFRSIYFNGKFHRYSIRTNDESKHRTKLDISTVGTSVTGKVICDCGWEKTF